MASLGGVNLPVAYGEDGCIRTIVDVGALHELLSGGLAYDYVGDRFHWAVRCVGCTGTERTNILAAYRSTTTKTFVPPDEGTYTVLTVPNSWRESYIEAGDGTKYYTIEFEVEETAAVAPA